MEDKENISIPKSNWYEFIDKFTRIDDLLAENLKVLKEMAARPAGVPGFIPPPPPPPALLDESYPFIVNQAKITTANQPFRLIGEISTVTVIIKANLSNSGNIYVGDKGVSSIRGYLLEPGAIIGGNIDNAKTSIYITGNTVGDGVSFMALVEG